MLLLMGLIATYFYFWGGKPDFFTSPVFAVYTSYAESRYFVIAQTNLLDEFGAVFSLIGLIFINFSKVKDEDDSTVILRVQALINAIFATTIVWILFFLFIFGWPIFIFSFFIFFILLILNFLIFRYKLLKYIREITILNRNKTNTKKNE